MHENSGTYANITTQNYFLRIANNNRVIRPLRTNVSPLYGTCHRHCCAGWCCSAVVSSSLPGVVLRFLHHRGPLLTSVVGLAVGIEGKSRRTPAGVARQTGSERLLVVPSDY